MLPIITSILDNDMYKILMGQAVFKLFPNEIVRYKFTDRNKKIYTQLFKNGLRSQINKMKDLKLTKDELNWLKTELPYLDLTYLDFLKNFRFNPKQVKIAFNEDELVLEIEGPWHTSIYWEVPILAIMSQLNYELIDKRKPYLNEKLTKINTNKIHKLSKDFVSFADFGTRRRSSINNHQKVINDFVTYANENPNTFVGTSNLFFAMLSNLKPIGTHAHEWFMFHGAKFGYKQANQLALDNWVDVYQGNLGIALTDTFTTDVFLRSFNMKYAKLFDGVRQDSGDPIEFGEKMVKHYKSLGIDPMSKTIVFSDGLDYEKAIPCSQITLALAKKLLH